MIWIIISYCFTYIKEIKNYLKINKIGIAYRVYVKGVLR